MHKTTTLKDFKVLVLKTFLPILVLSISFQVSFAQSFVMPNKKTVRQTQNPSAAFTPGMTKEMVKGDRSLLPGNQSLTATPTDVPSLNQQRAEKLSKATVSTPNIRLNSPTTSTNNIIEAVCTFNGSLAPGDPQLNNGRPFRSGVASTCAAPTACGAPFAGSGFYYDTYTMQNLTCAPQCVSVTYRVSPGGTGDVFVSAYLGSFNPLSLCTNRIADGGSSSVTPGVTVTFSFNLAVNATVVFVANIAFAAPCTAYDMTVTGLTCTPPPPCTPITSSVLSQTQYAGPPVNLINESFDVSSPYPASALPAGWTGQFLSQPPGLITVWYQGIPAVFPAHTGANYIAANYNHAGTALGTLSSWMFPPAFLLKNGDQFSFWTCHDPGNARPDRLQVRMNSTNNGTNVGATATSVGDFTTLLLDINPTYQTTGYPTTWTKFTITLSGLPPAGFAGRLAFRYFCEQSGGVGIGINSDYIGIDDVVYTTFTTILPQTCTGSTTNLNVVITGGTPGATYDMVLNRNPPGGAGGNFNVNNYTSGNNIPVTPAVTTTYSIVSIVDANNPCCTSTNNSGTPTVTVSALPITPIAIQENPTGPLCAGDPKLLTVIGATGLSTFANPAPITIPSVGTGTPYPSNIVVSGLPTTGVSVQSVRLIGMSHTWGDDIDILMQSPAPFNINVVLMSDVGGTVAVPNATYTFNDAGGPMSAGTANPTGTYRPTNNGATDTWVAPGPGVITQAAPALAMFGSVNDPNGTWKLFVVDDVGGDQGTIAGGWDITFTSPPAPPPVGWTFLWSPAAGLSSTTSNPVAASPTSTRQYSVLGTAPNGCNTSASVLITVYQLPAVTSNPSNITGCVGTTVTFTVGATGQGITYQWQESTNGGGTYTNITNGGIYGGATTTTLTLTGVTIGMNTYRYRCVISGTCPPAANSTGAILTVNPIPAVSISPVSPVCGGVAGTSGTALTASGATGSYTWSPVTGLFNNPNGTGAYTGTNQATVYAAPAVNTVYTVTGTNSGTNCSNTATISVVYTAPAPIVSPANVAMCLGDNAVQLCITSSLAPSPFTATYNSGAISVPFPGPPNPNAPAGASHSIAVPLPSTAQITRAEVAVNFTHTWDGDVVVVLKAPNNQVLNLDYFLSNTGGTGPTTGFTNTRFASNGVNAISTGTNPYNGLFKADAQTVATPNGATGPTGMTATTGTWNALYSTPNGNWTLGLYDGFAGDDGVLTSWSITFDYLYGPPAPGIWSPAAGLFSDAAATIPYVAGTSVNCVYAKPIPSGVYPYTVTVASTGFDIFPTFSNPAPITIPSVGTGTPYPSNIVVSGLPTTGASVESVILRTMSHTWSNDIDILLQSPTVQNVVLMSDVGGTGGINATYTFNDAAPTMNTAAPNPTGTYHPTDFADGSGGDNYPAPGPGVFSQVGPALAMFGNTANVNGTWKLFVVDDVGGDQGTIANGWTINFRHPSVGCTSPGRIVNVTVNQPTTVTTQPAAQIVCTDKVATFSVAVAGSGPFTYQWQESTDGGNTYNPINNGGVYSGATTANLTITAPPVTMSGYVYRCRIQGALPCAAIFSFFRTLTVNPLPTIVIGVPPYVVSLFPGMTTTLNSTVSPVAASTYTWLRNGVPVSGANTGILNVNVDGLGAYQLRVTDINNCTNISNTVIVKDSASGKCFIYPNPNSGKFEVRYYSVANNVLLPRSLTVYDSKGDRVLTQKYSIGRPYDRMEVDMRKNGKGLYWVEIGDVNGNRLTMCRIVIQ